MLHPGRVESGPPASVIVLSQLQVVALAMHPHRDMSNPGPRVQPRAESAERAVIRGHGTLGEADSHTEELAAWVEHGLLDHMIRPDQQRMWNREAEGFR